MGKIGRYLGCLASAAALFFAGQEIGYRKANTYTQTINAQFLYDFTGDGIEDVIYIDESILPDKNFVIGAQSVHAKKRSERLYIIDPGRRIFFYIADKKDKCSIFESGKTLKILNLDKREGVEIGPPTGGGSGMLYRKFYDDEKSVPLLEKNF